MQKITPFLWFDNQAEEAVNFYMRVFKDAKIDKVVRYGEKGPGPKGAVMTIEFHLLGQGFVALNGGPEYKFTPAISFVVNCENQEEVDHYWEALSADSMKIECGWVKDKYGISWQIVPTMLPRLLGDKDPAKAGRVMAAMLTMKKIEIQALEEAYAG